MNYDRRITIEELVPVKQASGQELEAWQPIPVNPTVYAHKVDRSGISQQEQVEAAQMAGKSYTVFTIRYRADLRRTMRIECEGVHYNIQSINEVGRRKELTIFTEQREQ